MHHVTVELWVDAPSEDEAADKVTDWLDQNPAKPPSLEVRVTARVAGPDGLPLRV